MKILFINDYAPTFPGAFFESLYALSETLYKKGDKLFFIFPLERDYIQRLEQFGTIIYCPSFMGKKFDWKLLKIVYKLCKQHKINIIHTNFGFAAPFIASLLSGILNFRHIAHERNPSKYYNNLQTSLIRKLRAGLFFPILAALGNTSYIAISTEVKESLVNYNHIRPNKVTIIPNAVLPNRSKFSDDSSVSQRLKEFKKSGYFLIGMTAHFGPQKDHSTLVKAAEIVIKKRPSSKFILIGGNLINDTDNYRGKIEQQIKDKGLKKHFEIIGEVKDPFPYIELVDIGCLISNWEGFGNALVEYMLKRKPVIGTAVGGIKDIIEDGENGFLVPPKNPYILADRIMFFIDNPSKREEMGKNAYEKASREYNMNRWVQRIIHVYENSL